MSYRIEKDTLGEVKVPADKYWGAQTERSRNNFKIGPAASMPKEIIRGFAYRKRRLLMLIMTSGYCLRRNATSSLRFVMRSWKVNLMMSFR